MKKILSLLTILVLALALAACGENAENETDTTTEIPTEPPVIATPAYLASAGERIPLYESDGSQHLTVAEELVRGTEVLYMDRTVDIEMVIETEESSEEVYDEEVLDEEAYEEEVPGEEAYEEEVSDEETTSEEPAAPATEIVTFAEVEYGGRTCYVEQDHMVFEYSEIMQETTRFVRTSVTVYKNSEDAQIESFLKKGAALRLNGFDRIDENGVVNMYEVTCGDVTGWVYGKYLAEDAGSATAPYNEDGTFDIHKDRTFTYELYGGSPATLDYYPYEKPVFKDHPMPEDARTMYLNCEAALYCDDYIDVALENGVNAMVIDIKDGIPAYESEVVKEFAPSSYAVAYATVPEYQTAVKKIKDAGIYTIGRIVVFSDWYYAQDHPETCIVSEITSGEWPSAYNRDVWYYNILLAQEAVGLMGFDEIQLDYVRFPESTWRISEYDPEADFRNEYDEEKAEAVQNFLFYAADQVHKAGAYLSVDVFGESASDYVTAYGQYWPAMSNIVDAISGMPYTDHYGSAVDTWSEPYNIVALWAANAAARQTEIPTPAVVRTWITGYNTPNWDPVVNYDAGKMMDQAQALYDNGLTGGFIPWNGISDIYKYMEYGAVWSADYTGGPDPSEEAAEETAEELSEETSEEATDDYFEDPETEGPTYEDYEDPAYEEPGDYIEPDTSGEDDPELP